MGAENRWMTPVAMTLLLTLVGLAGCAPAGDSEGGSTESGMPQMTQEGGERWSYQDWPTGPLPRGGRLAQAAPQHRSLSRGLDLGVLRRRVRRVTGPDLDRDAGRAPPSGRG